MFSAKYRIAFPTTSQGRQPKGAEVIVAARRVSEGQATVAMIKEAGGEAHFLQTDVSKATQVEALIAACLTNYGGLDYAVNNAGIVGTAYTPAAEYEEKIWDNVIDINLKGVWLCSEDASFVTGHAHPVDGGYLI